MVDRAHCVGVLTTNFTNIDPITRVQLHNRAHELAVIAGRVPPQVSQADYEEAKRELTAKPDGNQSEIALDSIPKSLRCEPKLDSGEAARPQT